MTKKIFSVSGLSLALFFALQKTALAIWSPDSLAGSGLPDQSIYNIIVGILDWLLTIVGIVGVIGFIIAGLMYLTSTGDDTKMKTAKSAMVAAIIGVIVAIIGVVVLRAVDTMLNAGYLF